MAELQSFFSGVAATKENLSAFAKTAFEAALDEQCLNAKLKVIVFPSTRNGVLTVQRNNKYVVRVNLHQLIHDADCSDAMKFFRLYTTVMHELAHIKHLSSIGDTYPSDFQVAMAMAEYVPGLRKLNNRYIYDQLHSPANHKQAQYRYNISISEQICIYQSYMAAYRNFGAFLSREEQDVLELAIRELSQLKNHIEVCYLSRMAPANKFMHFLRCTLLLQKKGKLVIDDYPVLKCFFDKNGELRSVSDFYTYARAEDNPGNIATQALLRLFMYQGQSFKELFENEPESFTYVENAANEYIKDSVSFIKASKDFTIFLDDKVREDNIALILHNIRMLNEQMGKFGMSQRYGTVHPLYKYMN